MREKVEGVLERPQLRDGEMVDWLVELGPDASPILADMLETHKFPCTLLKALGRLRDKRTTLRLIEYLLKNRPFYPDVKTEVKFSNAVPVRSVIRTLKEIGDIRAEKPLMNMVLSKGTFLGTRLSSAAAIARFGSPLNKRRCKEFIMDIWHSNRYDPIKKLHYAELFGRDDTEESIAIIMRLIDEGKLNGVYYNSMTLESSLRVALFEVDTIESINILRILLKDDSEPHLQKEIMTLFAKKQKQGMLTALKEFCNNEKQHPISRLHCIEAVHQTGKVSKKVINGYIDRIMSSKISKEVRSDAEILREVIK